jgi:thiol-disulfide isomerase/thioredoxin
MTYLAAAVAGLAALCLVNLWLTIALARQLRAHGQQLAQRGPRPRPAAGLPPGTQVPDFTVTTVTGDSVSAADLRSRRGLIAFFSPDCAPCHEQLPAFTAFARSWPHDAARPLAVICNGRGPGPDQDAGAGHLARDLADVADVVREPSAGPVAAALAVTGFPTFILLGADGRVAAGAHAVAAVAAIAGLASPV